MLSANEILHAVNSNKRDLIADTYSKVFPGEKVDWNCSSCIHDAKIRLNVYLRELERKNSPIVIYAVNPSDEVKFQLGEFIEVAGEQEAFAMMKADTVNVVTLNCFFDETLDLVKQIKPYQTYKLDAYNWNGNGHATLEMNNPGVYVFRGKPKPGQAVLNPYRLIHAIRAL